MPYVSKLPPGCPIIDAGANSADADNMFAPRIRSAGGLQYKGRIPRDWQREPFGRLEFAGPLPAGFAVPRSQWAQIIEYRDAQKARLSDLILRSAPYIPSLSQGSTNYCWANAVITAIETLRELNGQPYIKLSAASVAAPIKNYRNNGGWGGEALAYIVKNGVAPVEFWPANAISASYNTPATQAARARFMVSEFYELESGDFGSLASLLLQGIPAAIGLNWWSHEVCALDLVALTGGKFGVVCRNSWGDEYGDGHGLFVLTEAKATPDDCCAPGVTTATPTPRP